jgi:hypothetical protein
MRKSLMIISLLLVSLFSFSQDTSSKEFHVSGSIGVTNNGISIIPTFSLKEPAFSLLYSFSRGGRFSIDPDIRLTFDGRKGSGLLWFRYKLKTEGKFKVNIGIHPAYNLALRTITEEGKPLVITQARRFIATEFAPTYKVNNHLNFGIYYLKGTGLQKDGPQSVHFVNFITGVTNIPLTSGYSFNVTPQLYYLKSDKQDGYYFNSNVVLAKQNSPFVLMYMLNKEIRSNVAGSVNFDWNISLLYNFKNKFKRFK